MRIVSWDFKWGAAVGASLLLQPLPLSSGFHSARPSNRGLEQVLPKATGVVPPHKVWDRSFTLNYAAEVTFHYQIEEGKELDIYVVTAEQDARASAGHEPTQLGTDFVSKNRGVVGPSGQVLNLSVGRYGIVFRNLSDEAVRLTSWADGTRN